MFKQDELTNDNSRARLADNLVQPLLRFDKLAPHVIGVLHGEGIGPEVVPVAIDLLRTIARFSKRDVQIYEAA